MPVSILFLIKNAIYPHICTLRDCDGRDFFWVQIKKRQYKIMIFKKFIWLYSNLQKLITTMLKNIRDRFGVYYSF